MTKTTIIINELDNQEYALIDRGNGEFTSMLKSTWDELEAAEENGTLS